MLMWTHLAVLLLLSGVLQCSASAKSGSFLDVVAAGVGRRTPSSGNKQKKNDPKAAFFSRLEQDNAAAFNMLSQLMTSTQGWTHVATNQGVTVERRSLAPGPFVDKSDAAKAGKHACVKSTGLVDCDAESVFRLFMDRDRVREYNEHVSELRDVHYFPKKSNDNFSKITWACGPSYGPFKARDFVSVVHFQKFPNGTYVILNRPAYHSDWKPNPDKFVRATVLLAGNVMEPRGPDGKQCFLTQIAHINPGGVADTPAIAWVINKLCATGPPNFIRKLEKEAKRSVRISSPLAGLRFPSKIITLPDLPELKRKLKLMQPKIMARFGNHFKKTRDE